MSFFLPLYKVPSAPGATTRVKNGLSLTSYESQINGNSVLDISLNRRLTLSAKLIEDASKGY